MADGRRRRLAALGIASAGLLVGHWLTYLITAPDAGHRTAGLARAGHGYLSVANELAAVFMAVSLAALVLGRLVAAGSGAAPGRSLAVRLIVLQTGGFAAMELLERLIAGAGLHDLVALLPVGLAVNVAVAVAGSLLLRSILHLADRAAAVLARHPAPTRARSVAVPLRLPAGVPRALHPCLAVLSTRAPPSPVLL